MRKEKVSTDFLVLGSGIAGITFALKVAPYGKCLVVTKKADRDTSTNFAQGGIACVIDPNDSFEEHIEDTLKTGCGLSRRESVEVLVHEGPSRVQELVEYGADFTTYVDRNGRKCLKLTREGGHSRHRIVHSKDTTGQEVESILLETLYRTGGDILQNHIVVGLISDGDRVYGAYIYDRNRKKLLEVHAARTMLATGGAGRLYPYTTNPPVATGEGFVLAWRAGARLKNLEFIQFHPTALYQPDQELTGDKLFLISEAVRGEGGILRNVKGERFMESHPLQELAPRDEVAKEIDRQICLTKHPCVYLELMHLKPDFIRDRFPNIHRECERRGIDMTVQPIPVVPAAHYFCGGVETDLDGKTSLEGLYASGEVACTGVHGANRLASNSLLEALVFSHRAAQDALRGDTSVECPAESRLLDRDSVPVGIHLRSLWDEYQHAVRLKMNRYVSIVRNRRGLSRALSFFSDVRTQVDMLYVNSYLQVDAVETRGITLLSELVVKCAILRKESRGCHYNSDYPERGDSLYDTVIDLRHPQGAVETFNE